MPSEDLEMQVDAAHLAAMDLAEELLEYCNAYRRLSSDEYLGKERLRYMVLLTMFEELSKLMLLMRDCERAVTHKDPFVRIPGFYVSGGERSLESMIKEVAKSEKLSMSVKKVLGREPNHVDFVLFKQQFSSGGGETAAAVSTAQFMDVRATGRPAPPAPEIMDMFFEAIEMNAQGAYDFLFDWARAKELEVDHVVVCRRDAGSKGMGAKTWTRRGFAPHGKED
jgi:hypothetical protein